MSRPPQLAGALDDLEKHYGRPDAPPSRDPFELILWENVAYLVTDEKRGGAFAALKRQVGTTPERILAAPPRTLRQVAAQGGMLPDLRVGKLLRSAEIARTRFQSDLAAAARQPLPAARKAMAKFPGIGEPGAEKVLLFSGHHPVFAMDSNVMRVLLRLGFGEEKKAYAATYRSVQEAATAQAREDCGWLTQAYQLLRRHGQELCRRTRPRCPDCPCRGRCAFYARGVPPSGKRRV